MGLLRERDRNKLDGGAPNRLAGASQNWVPLSFQASLQFALITLEEKLFFQTRWMQKNLYQGSCMRFIKQHLTCIAGPRHRSAEKV